MMQNNASLPIPQMAMSTAAPPQNTWMSATSYATLSSNVVYPRINSEVNPSANDGPNPTHNNAPSANYNISIPYHFGM